MGRKPRRRVDVVNLAVDPHAGQPRLLGGGDRLLPAALLARTKRRQNHQPGAFGQAEDRLDDLLGRLLLDRGAATWAMRVAQPGEHEPQKIVNLGHRRDGASWVVDPVVLLDAQRRRQGVDGVHVGPLHLLQKLPGIDGKAFDVLPLAFGMKRVDGQRALARPAWPGQRDQAVVWNVEIDILEIVLSRPADADGAGRRVSRVCRFIHGCVGSDFGCGFAAVGRWAWEAVCWFPRPSLPASRCELARDSDRLARATVILGGPLWACHPGHPVIPAPA